jgi:hypothetical protein
MLKECPRKPEGMDLNGTHKLLVCAGNLMVET